MKSLKNSILESYTKDKYFKTCMKFIKAYGNKLYKDYFEWFANVLADIYRREDMEAGLDDFNYDYLENDIWDLLDAGSNELFWVAQFILNETDISDYVKDEIEDNNISIEDLWKEYISSIEQQFGDNGAMKIKIPNFR